MYENVSTNDNYKRYVILELTANIELVCWTEAHENVTECYGREFIEDFDTMS